MLVRGRVNSGSKQADVYVIEGEEENVINARQGCLRASYGAAISHAPEKSAILRTVLIHVLVLESKVFTPLRFLNRSGLW